MDLKEKTLPELKEELSQVDFQWIKGDKMGNVEKFEGIFQDESTGMTFVTFIGGARINIELLEEYLEAFPASKVDYNNNAGNIDLTQPDSQPQQTQPQKSSQKPVETRFLLLSLRNLRYISY